MTFEERVAITYEMFLQAIREQDLPMSGDQRVDEATAERLVGYAPRTFRRLRECERAPAAYRLGNRWTYRVRTLAEFVEENYEGR